MKDEEPNKPDVVKIEKKLPIQEFEGYAVLDFLPDEAPAALIPPSPEQLDLLRRLLDKWEEGDTHHREAEAVKRLIAWFEWHRDRA